MSDAPAILGGEPVFPDGPPPWPIEDAAVLDALKAAYHDGGWGKYDGGRVKMLEDHLRTQFEVRHALVCSSGTFAVELALRGLKVGPGAEVVMAAYDYPGNFLAVHAVGAQPVLVDISEKDASIDINQLNEAIGPATAAILVSHLHGALVPMVALRELADARGVPIVEDAAQCPGASIEGKLAGSWGDAGILSFGGSKLLTAGRGGAVLTNRDDVYQRMRTYQVRGNYVAPMSELQAAVLLPQLASLEERNRIRAANVETLIKELAGLPGVHPFVDHAEGRAFYKLGFRYDAERFGLPREALVAAARAEGIALDAGFRAVHAGRSPRRYRACGSLPQATAAHRDVVILHHPVLLQERSAIERLMQGLRRIHQSREAIADRIVK